MDKLDQLILKLTESLYEISDEERQWLIESFSRTNEEDKKQIAEVLMDSYNKMNSNLKQFLYKFNKINNELTEYKERLNVDDILDHID